MKQFIISIVILLILYPLCVYAHKKDILVIESYDAGHIWDASYKEGLEEILGDKYNLVYFEMDTKRLPKSEFEKRAQMAWDKYKQVNPALVILGDDNALKYLGPKFINTTTPVVYLGINNNPRNYDMHRHKNITGVLERPLLKRSIVLIRKLLDIKKALLLFDRGVSSQIVFSEYFSGKNKQSLGGIRLDIKLIGDFAEWEKNVLNAKKQGYDVILIGGYHAIRDDNGKHVDAIKMLEWTSENTPVPPFSFWDFSIGPRRTIGGYVIFGKEHGKTAGELALKILSNKNYRNIVPIIAERGRYFFSKTQLKKWGISLTDKIDFKVEYTK